MLGRVALLHLHLFSVKLWGQKKKHGKGMTGMGTESRKEWRETW